MLPDEALADQMPFKATLPLLACFFVRGSAWRSQVFKGHVATKGNEEPHTLSVGKQSSCTTLCVTAPVAKTGLLLD